MTLRDYLQVMKHVGIADLEAHLSEHLRSVRDGEELVIMDRRTPIARVVPFDQAEEDLPIEPARGSLVDFPWPGPVPGADGIDVVATLQAERADRS